MTLPSPTLADNVCDLARLEQGLSRQHGLDSLAADFFMLRHLAQVMREDNFRVTATLDFAQRRSRNPRVVKVESGDTTQRHFAIAIDIGTTTVWVQIIDLAKGEIVGTGADYNGQLSYGDDVITRIIFSQKDQGLQKLQRSVAATINQIMHRVLKRHHLSVTEISHITLAANTTMTHLFYGIDPKNIRLSPYTPAACHLPPVGPGTWVSICRTTCFHLFGEFGFQLRGGRHRGRGPGLGDLQRPQADPVHRYRHQRRDRHRQRAVAGLRRLFRRTGL